MDCFPTVSTKNEKDSVIVELNTPKIYDDTKIMIFPHIFT